jgi:glutathione peroxidase
MKTIYDYSFTDTSGAIHHMDAYRGKTVLIVNTATKCGFAGQFIELESLWRDYRQNDFVVIGFPCDQFAHQEPVANKDMVQTCQINYGVSFLLSEKIKVNGPDTHPLFEFLKSHSNSGLIKRIKWNFTKFLISPDGTIIQRFAPSVTPFTIKPAIEKLVLKQRTN